jgi:hypothetical protein
VLEHPRADLAFHVLAELNAFNALRQQLSQPVLSRVKRLGANVVTADRQQIEGDEPNLVMVLAGMKPVELRDAVAIQPDRLTINHTIGAVSPDRPRSTDASSRRAGIFERRNRSGHRSRSGTKGYSAATARKLRRAKGWHASVCGPAQYCGASLRPQRRSVRPECRRNRSLAALDSAARMIRPFQRQQTGCAGYVRQHSDALPMIASAAIPVASTSRSMAASRMSATSASSGYNAWADTNHLIVLYPQIQSSSRVPYNPQKSPPARAHVSKAPTKNPLSIRGFA